MSELCNVDPSQDPTSPYYLHASENPFLVIVPNVLEGTNYHQWSRSVRMSLVSKNKLGFVDGTIEAPGHTNSLYSTWERANIMVVSWLLRSLSPTIAQSVIWMETASHIWNELKERFSQGDMLRIADLQDLISSFKQGELTVTNYFTELKILWDELEVFRPLPTCSCAIKCSCNVMTNFSKYKTECTENIV
uniref:Retrotransposon Copia-like N-terminal domain-containing protein n=1 Tax=Cajanus cajan TaxID=3821 RepID=A0A151QMB6_CAJCA|nr:hypothetical protein KK1_048262 [Cajanus cajan]